MPKYFAECAPEIALAWSRAKQAVCTGPTPSNCVEVANVKIQWRKVTGPLSNMVASLYAIGWNPWTFSEWIAPNGDSWSVPTSIGSEFCPSHLVYAIQDQASMILWVDAAKHFNGKGLQNGIAHEYSMRVLLKYRKEQIYDRAAALETILVGACWAPQRKYDAGLITLDDNVCPACHEVGVDDFHQFWGCPALEHNAWPEIASTN